MNTPHFKAAQILFQGGWNIRQFFSYTDHSETISVTNGDDELSITSEIFGALIDSRRADYNVIFHEETAFGIEKKYAFKLLENEKSSIIRLDINYDIPEDAGIAFEAHETRCFTDTAEGLAEAIRQAQTINAPQPGESKPDIVANEVEVWRCTLNGCAYVCYERIAIPEVSAEMTDQQWEAAISGVSDDHPGME